MMARQNRGVFVRMMRFAVAAGLTFWIGFAAHAQQGTPPAPAGARGLKTRKKRVTKKVAAAPTPAPEADAEEES